MEIPGVPEGPDWVSLGLGGPTIVRTQRERRREGSERSVDRRAPGERMETSAECPSSWRKSGSRTT